MQARLTQKAIASTLDISLDDSQSFSHVRLKGKEALAFGGFHVVRIYGNFDLKIHGQKTILDSPFELFLQPGERNQSWRLAMPVGSQGKDDQQWVTYPLF